MSFFEVRDLSFSYDTPSGPVDVLKNVSFSAEKNETTVILGRSGCGKTTLLSCLAGYLAPSSGEAADEKDAPSVSGAGDENGRPSGRTARQAGSVITVDGSPAVIPSPDVMMVFQSFDQLFPWFSLRDNILYAMKRAKASGNDGSGYRARADRLLAEAGLAGHEDRRPPELSGGMKQRGAIARVLALDPLVILMDEPFSSLDYLTKLGMYDFINSTVKSRDLALILVTHDIDEAVLLGDSLLVLAGDGSGICYSARRGELPEERLREELISHLA